MNSSNVLKIMDLAMKQTTPPLTRLVRGKPIAQGREAIQSLSEKDLESNPQSLPFIQAALYLCFDCFDEAHQIANDHEGTAVGNWLHAIAHRREPDPSNSKYWYHRVNAPAKVFEGIGGQALALLKKAGVAELEPLVKKLEKSKTWEPEAFVDFCAGFGWLTVGKLSEKDLQSTPYRLLAGVQEIEWRGLAEHILSS
jgi:hypothetical protein